MMIRFSQTQIILTRADGVDTTDDLGHEEWHGSLATSQSKNVPSRGAKQASVLDDLRATWGLASACRMMEYVCGLQAFYAYAKWIELLDLMLARVSSRGFLGSQRL